MANNQKPTNNILHKQEPFIQNNMEFHNNTNSEPMQVNVRINSSINFNLARNILPSTDHNTSTINMNMNIKKINVQEQKADDDNKNKNSEDEDEEINDMEYFTPPTSQKNRDAQ